MKKIIHALYIPFCLIGSFGIVLPILTQCNNNNNNITGVSVTAITANGTKNAETTTQLILKFNTAVPNLSSDGTDFVITDGSGSPTSVVINSSSTNDGGEHYTININKISNEGQAIKIIVNKDGYSIAQFNGTIVLHKFNYTADGKNWVGYKSGGLVKNKDYLIDKENHVITYSHTLNNLQSLNYIGENLKIPDTIYEHGVEYTVSIGMGIFYKCSGLSGVLTIPSGISLIGENAFNGCNKLSGLDLSGFNGSIGTNAFSGCSRLTHENVTLQQSGTENSN
ncbi:hypothetical protein FACS189459_7080 [Bacilli bacterium]|nr:hypothetical protein FACS189459_7080 [Bacilli bacterium]